MVSATAPGKVILFGEHAVVYGQPAIAVPVKAVQARATVAPAPAGTPFRLVAPDINGEFSLTDDNEPLIVAARLLLREAGLAELAATVTVASDIPIASGMGSGAATAAAVIKALALFLDRPDLATPVVVSGLTFEVERLHHGTPSGIDNTAVSFARPVYFIRLPEQNKIETFRAAAPFELLIGDTGIASPTRLAVADVRRHWEADREGFEALFAGCGRIANAARRAILAGDVAALGPLMNENHALLQAMTVSSPELDQLVEAALQAGALGAKLSGGGRGGNMIALVTPASRAAVRAALLDAGAVRVISTIVGQEE
jgi:mevalonate kinase